MGWGAADELTRVSPSPRLCAQLPVILGLLPVRDTSGSKGPMIACTLVVVLANKRSVIPEKQRPCRTNTRLLHLVHMVSVYLPVSLPSTSFFSGLTELLTFSCSE